MVSCRASELLQAEIAMPPANVKRQCDSLADRFELEEAFSLA